MRGTVLQTKRRSSILCPCLLPLNTHCAHDGGHYGSLEGVLVRERHWSVGHLHQVLLQSVRGLATIGRRRSHLVAIHHLPMLLKGRVGSLASLRLALSDTSWSMYI